MSKILKCHPGIGNKTEGIVLCAKDNFSARYDLDRVKGVFSRPQHKLFGKSYKNKILVLLEGSHGFKILKKCSIIEIKQGPFSLALDKERFKKIDEKYIKIKK